MRERRPRRIAHRQPTADDPKASVLNSIDLPPTTVDEVVPVKPFWGVMGVAPPASMGRVSSGPPNVFGGNLDNRDLGAGSTLYLPVHVPDALLSIGDGHAVQGHGEVCLSAVETSLKGEIQVVLHKGRSIRWPRAETATHYVTMGLAADLDEAARIATREMLDFIVENKKLSREDAYMLASAAMDLIVTQVVDSTKGIRHDAEGDLQEMMKRRDLFQVMAGLALAGARGTHGQARRVVVAGGGIMGSAIALRLAQRGAHVTLIEKGQPGGGATANSFAWINATFSKQPRAYFDLNRLGILAWRQTDRELDGALQVQWGGSIEWYADEANAKELTEQVRAHQAWGYGVRLIDAMTLRALEPKLNPGILVRASHADEEGNVDPVHATHTLLASARAAGATVMTGTAITGLDRPSGRLRAVQTAAGGVEADVLVVACGVETPKVAAMAGLDVPLQDSPGLLAHTKPLPRLINRVTLAPKAHMKQKADGRMVVGEGFGGSATDKASLEEGRRALSVAKGFLPDLDVDAIDRVTLGWRPLPKDGFPIVGFSPRAPDIYLAVMHSGITLSPFIGKAAAVEILDGVELDALRPYRLSRFGVSSQG